MRVPIRTSLLVLALSASAAAQDPDLKTKDTIPGGPPKASPPQLQAGQTEERMWAPPTEADWNKPVLIKFERTWADAVAVARETNKPILVCINMDGEIASEHYAGVHYRNPETAKLMQDYVCVIASVYRHTPRDHDAQGNRIPCPRFGCVTCGEHIAIEPLLYEKFMGGKRISPRHIMVELDGNEVFDVFHAWDNKSIFDVIEKGISERKAQPRTVVRGDRPVLERVGSRAREDREAVEAAYSQADRATREQLLRKALENPQAAPVGLLRLAIFDVDEGLARLAREALVKVDSRSAVDLLAEALRVPMAENEREALVGALDRLRGTSRRAGLLANVHRGLAAGSKTVDLERWGGRMAGGAVYQPADAVGVDRRADEREAAAVKNPKDANALLGLAESSLELILDPATAERYTGARGYRFGQLLFEDAKRNVADARKAGATGWKADAIEALCENYTGSRQRAHELAIQAATAMPPEPDSLVAVSTLSLFAEARIAAIWEKLRKKEDWPGAWMTDVNSAYSVLLKHPLGTDRHAVVHVDFLRLLGATRRSGRVLEQAIDRFPNSSALHERLRTHVLDVDGLAGLERRYAELIRGKPDVAALRWYAGYAAMVEAEFHRREKRPEQAVTAYDRAIKLFDESIERAVEFKQNADHYVALALAGKGRLAIEAGELDKALELCLAGIARRPEATPFIDGLQISPVQTAKLLESRLEKAGKAAGLKRLQDVLAGLDPELLEPPEYESPRPRRRGPRGQRGRRR